MPADDVNRHSGAGRFSFLRMRPMGLFESGHATGEVSLAALLDGDAPRAGDAVLAVDAGGLDGPLSERTVARYLDALSRLMVIEDQPAWAPHLRSKAVLRKSPKRHFVCPSLAVAALRAGPEPLLADLNLLGLLFESLVVRDLRVLSQPLDGCILHYRDNYGVEIDAIVQLPDGRWGAFEIKLGAGQIDAGASSLLRFREQLDLARCGDPAVLGVLCGTGYAYRRDDGVAVIPIGALGP